MNKVEEALKGTRSPSREDKIALLWFLKEWGAVSNDSGFAASEIEERIKRAGYKYRRDGTDESRSKVGSDLIYLEDKGLIIKDTQARKTYEVCLVDDDLDIPYPNPFPTEKEQDEEIKEEWKEIVGEEIIEGPSEEAPRYTGEYDPYLDLLVIVDSATRLMTQGVVRQDETLAQEVESLKQEVLTLKCKEREWRDKYLEQKQKADAFERMYERVNKNLEAIIKGKRETDTVREVERVMKEGSSLRYTSG